MNASQEQITTKFFAGSALRPQSLDTKKRRVDAILTERRLDRDDEIIEPRAFEETLDEFKANSPLFFNHDSRAVPIGRVDPDTIQISNERLEGTLQFRGEGRSKLADEVWRGVEDGVLRNVSIGFRIREMQGDGTKGNPVRVTKGDLLEVSVVGVPANPGANLKALRAAVKRLAPAVLAEAPDADLLRETIVRLSRKAWVEEPELEGIADELAQLEAALRDLPAPRSSTREDQLAGLVATLDRINAIL